MTAALVAGDLDRPVMSAVDRRSAGRCEIGARGCGGSAWRYLPVDRRTDSAGILAVCRPCVAWAARNPARVAGLIIEVAS